jgi:hypothetical protein
MRSVYVRGVAVLAYEAEFTGRRLAHRTYLVFDEGTSCVITLTTLPDLAEEYAESFDRSVRTFRLL